MSLINDALKRAKQAQKKEAQNAGPLFRPVEAAGHDGKRFNLLLPAAIFIALALIAFGVWQFQKTGSPKAALPPKTTAGAAKKSPVSSSKPAVAPPAPAPLANPVEPKPPISVSTEPAAKAPPAAAGANTNVPASPSIADSNPVVDVEPVTAPASSWKLQAIFFNPNRPSAIISGMTVFVGDRLGDFRVAALGRNSATLVSGSCTNVLILGD